MCAKYIPKCSLVVGMWSLFWVLEFHNNTCSAFRTMAVSHLVLNFYFFLNLVPYCGKVSASSSSINQLYNLSIVTGQQSCLMNPISLDPLSFIEVNFNINKSHDVQHFDQYISPHCYGITLYYMIYICYTHFKYTYNSYPLFKPFLKH